MINQLHNEKNIGINFKNLNIALCIFIFIFMILHAALRGTQSDLDAIVYAGFLKELSEMSFGEFLDRLKSSGWIFQTRDDSLARFEWGFALFAWITTLFGYNLKLSFGLIAFFSLMPKMKAVLSECKMPLLSAIWYFCLCYPMLEMSAIRAGLAAGLLIGYAYLLQGKRPYLYLIVIIVGMTFHVSAISGVILLLIKLIYKRVNILSTLMIVFILFYSTQKIGLDLMPFEISKLNDYKLELNSDGLYSSINIINSITVSIIMAFIIYSVTFSNNKDDFAVKFYKIIYLLPLIYLTALSSFPILGLRLSEFFYAFGIFLIGGPLKGKAKNSNFYFMLIIIISFLLMLNHQFRIQNTNILYPFLKPSQIFIEYYDLKVGSDKRLYELSLEGL
jgi:hypothetical protein